jgi:hypothetical protein
MDLPEVIPFTKKVEQFRHNYDASAGVHVRIIESAGFLDDMCLVDAAKHAASLGLCSCMIYPSAFAWRQDI